MGSLRVRHDWATSLSLFTFTHGENGNPLQCSCLENPRDGGAWWAAVYGVTQSQTRLKRLSSRSSSIQYEVTLLICAVCVPCAQLYSSPSDPLNCSSPGSSVHGTLQARILEWVAIPCSRGTSQPRDQTQVSHCGQILYRLSHQGSPTREPDQ